MGFEPSMLSFSNEHISFVTEVLIPLGLVSIMFSLGLSLNIIDFVRIFRFPKAVLLGVPSQIVLFPLIAFIVASQFVQSDTMALSLILIAACPGGVTSNALIFYARADIALSVLITSLSSLIVVFTAPVIISIAVNMFSGAEPRYVTDVPGLTGHLFLYSTTPIIAGMIFRIRWPLLAARVVVLFRPALLGILLTVIAFSLLVNKGSIYINLKEVVPVALALNFIGMSIGFFLGNYFKLTKRQCATITVELGVQNVTMATFLCMFVLEHKELAAVPTIYGVTMVISALIFLHFYEFNKSDE